MTNAAARPSPWRRFTADERRTDVAIAAATIVVAVALLTASSDGFDIGWPDVVAGVGAFVLVLERRRWPIPLLAVALVWSVGFVLIWDRPSIMVFAVFVLLFTACVSIARGPAILLGAATAAVLYGLAVKVNDDLAAGDPRVLIGVVWSGAAVGVADAVRSWRRYREAAEMQVRSAVLAADARTRQQVSEERLTIARELHDLLAHNLSVMHVQTGAALHLLRSDPDRAEESLSAARDAGRSILDELRELLAVLRDDAPDQPGDEAPRTALPTVDDVAALVDTMRSAGFAIVWTDTGAPQRLAPAVSLAAYRIVQEALTNAAKHGDGTATLTTEWNNRSVTITVINPVRPHGITNKVPSRGHGLVGMRERALTNGGSFEAGETANDFEVRARLPVATQHQEAHQ
jgi:signal transduction histidine kinase